MQIGVGLAHRELNGNYLITMNCDKKVLKKVQKEILQSYSPRFCHPANIYEAVSICQARSWAIGVEVGLGPYPQILLVSSGQETENSKENTKSEVLWRGNTGA